MRGISGRGRPNFCYRCFKAQILCVCDVAPIENRTHVAIIQHPAERFHPVNSAILTHLALTNSDLRIAWGAETAPPPLPGPAVVLFPSKASVPLESLRGVPGSIVVLDGTWSQARKLYRRNAWLSELKHVHLTPTAPSRYRIRKQPKEGYLSTLEATVAALEALEPDTNCSALLSRFDQLIDAQAKFIEAPPEGAYVHTQRPPRPKKAPKLLENRPSLTLIYADFSAIHGDGTYTPVSIAAHRLHDGATLELFCAPPAACMPTPIHLEHMGIEKQLFADALSRSAAQATLRDFVGTTTLVGWKKRNVRRLCEALELANPIASLKGAWSDWHGDAPGTLDALATSLGEESKATTRASRRLTATRAVFEALGRRVEAAQSPF